MDSNRFDDLTRTLGTRHDRRSAVKILGAAALGAAGVIGIRSSGGAEPKDKVSICHRTESGTYNYISVSENAIPAHTAHGDAIAPDFSTDAAHCGGCGNVCSAPENATASCSEAVCGFTCNTGYESDGNGGCELPVVGCASAAIVGTAGFFCFDDEAQIYVNDVLVFQHIGTTACFFEPIALGTVADGDSIHVVANNSPFTCGDISIDPFQLVCQETGVVQVLDPIGVVGGSQAACGAVFYDRYFTADL